MVCSWNGLSLPVIGWPFVHLLVVPLLSFSMFLIQMTVATTCQHLPPRLVLVFIFEWRWKQVNVSLLEKFRLFSCKTLIDLRGCVISTKDERQRCWMRVLDEKLDDAIGASCSFHRFEAECSLIFADYEQFFSSPGIRVVNLVH